jgi:hypothetical protein
VNVFLVAVCIAAGCACVVTDSAGKFTASASADSAARVAKWSFDATSSGDGFSMTVDKDGALQSGPTGSYAITVTDNASEVAATYQIVMDLPDAVTEDDAKALNMKLTREDTKKEINGVLDGDTVVFADDSTSDNSMTFPLSSEVQAHKWNLTFDTTTAVQGQFRVSVVVTQVD